MTPKLIDSADSTPIARASDKRPYRISLIHPSAGVNWSGGSEIIAIELARHLSAYFEVELLSGAPCGELSHPIGGVARTYAYRVSRHPLIAKLLHGTVTHPDIVVEHVTNFLPCVARLLSRPSDLIFPHNDYGGLAMASCVRALTGTPILYTEHNSLIANGKCLKRNLSFRPDQLVVYSEAVAAFVRTLEPTRSVEVIPNGVDLSRFTPQGSQIDFGLARPIVLCVSSLYCNNHKRLELAIRAVARLEQASLLVCGAGPDRDHFQALGEELLGPERFAIHTFSYEQMPEVYRSADAFTLPSINEPFGLAYIEAMASGLPVVATNDEIRLYIIADGGIVCDVTDLDAYAAALAEILSGEWKERARQSALRFSWEQLALRYRDVILKTIAQSKKGDR